MLFLLCPKCPKIKKCPIVYPRPGVCKFFSSQAHASITGKSHKVRCSYFLFSPKTRSAFKGHSSPLNLISFFETEKPFKIE